jgi:hypothetical protein
VTYLIGLFICLKIEYLMHRLSVHRGSLCLGDIITAMEICWLDSVVHFLVA